MGCTDSVKTVSLLARFFHTLSYCNSVTPTNYPARLVGPVKVLSNK